MPPQIRPFIDSKRIECSLFVGSLVRHADKIEEAVLASRRAHHEAEAKRKNDAAVLASRRAHDATVLASRLAHDAAGSVQVFTWSCRYCTQDNELVCNVCSMCNKSRC